MAVCPVCHSEIEITSQHYGTLFTCSQCRAVFFVDWGGQPEAVDLEAPPEEVPTFSDVPQAESPYAESSFAPAPHFETPDQNAFEAPEEAPADAVEESPPYDFGAPMAHSTEPVEDPAEPISSLVETSLSDVDDIAHFGNAELSQSAFSYTLTIAGIDSGVLRAGIQEAISDSKFGWNVVQVMAQIKGGVLTIKSMNPVKASILMQRVKYLPVQVSWRQDVLSSTV